MSITIRYFASLREHLGRAEQCIPAETVKTVGEAWRHANPAIELPGNSLMAVNMEYADTATPVQDGDEVAFFPPVTGG